LTNLIERGRSSYRAWLGIKVFPLLGSTDSFGGIDSLNVSSKVFPLLGSTGPIGVGRTFLSWLGSREIPSLGPTVSVRRDRSLYFP